MSNNNQRSFEMAIAQRREKFMMLVPDHISDKEGYLNRLAFECDMLLHNSPRLAVCDPKSIMLGAMEAARHRLYFSQGECSLIPFKNQAVFVLGVAGICKILARTGMFLKIKYGTVFENDHFEFSEGSGIDDDFCKQRKALKNRGGVLAAWASVAMKDGTTSVYIMDHDTLMKVKNSSPGGGANYDQWPEEMYAKAPLKRLFKRVRGFGDNKKEVSEAMEAINADMTFRAEPESEPVFFEEAVTTVEKPAVEEVPKEEVVEQTGEVLV
jgi:recombination protein RecT